jgi:quercetin dioxygenase-like cupin family protein
MQVFRLDHMKGGWFVGQFAPTAFRTSDAEVAVKSYPAGASEGRHHHKVAVELTVVISGRVRMFDREFSTGDIVRVEPGESTGFEAVTDATTVVVKQPSVLNDKYVG